MHLAKSIAVAVAGPSIRPTSISHVEDNLLPMDCSSLTGVEIGMANFDGRLPLFREPEKDSGNAPKKGKLPVGMNCLEMPGEQGMTNTDPMVIEMIKKIRGDDILESLRSLGHVEADEPKDFLETEFLVGQPSYYLAPNINEYDNASLIEWEKAAKRITQDGIKHVYVAPYYREKAVKDEATLGVLRHMLTSKKK